MILFYCIVNFNQTMASRSETSKQKSQAQKSKPVQQSIPSWEEVRPQLAAVLSSNIEEFPPPFDAASDVPIDQQKEDCMKKIQKLMREHKYENAIGTFRAAREVWPEEGIFGVPGIEADEELDMLETIYSTDLGVELENMENGTETQENSEYDEEEDEEEEEESTTAVVETDFDFQDFVQRFCHPRVVSACASLLEGCERNPPHTNHCLLKMLHRIAWDCKRPSMMFQATLFLVFQKVLASPMPHLKELEKFAIFILRKFTEIASKNPKAFIELLFWKTSKDAIEIELGYDLYNDGRDKPAKGVWTEEQEEELRKLYMENQANPATDQDVIDWILDNLIDQTRTRRGVIKKMKELGLIFRAPTKRSNKERVRERVPKEFSEEEDVLLKELWDQYGESTDPMGLIMARMPRKRQKRSYVDRLLELGLIQDAKQCRKKRQGKSGKRDTDDKSDDNSSDSASSDQSDSEDDVRASPTSNKPTNNTKAKTGRNKSANKNGAKGKEIQLSANEIGRLLIQAVDEGLIEALKWLAENLEEVALDQEAEGYDPNSEGTPLVPISRDSVEAMNSKLFKKVLKGVGVVPPLDEQETYWRIPSSLHFETIRKRREIILKAINKELIIDGTAIDDKPNEVIEEQNQSESSDDDDLFERLRKMRDESVENSLTKSNKSNAPSNTKKSNSRKRSRSIDSSEENSREKMQKIDEADEENVDDDDILAFAKRTLQHTELPDTEDILLNLPTHSDDSDKEDEEIVLPAKRRKLRVMSDDD